MWEIIFYSRGGQGAVTASKILTEASIFEGKFAQSIPSYGQERKGAPVYTYGRIDDDRIETKSYVYDPNLVILFDTSLIEIGIKVFNGLKGEGILVVNSDKKIELPSSVKKAVYVDALKITSEEIGDVPPNIAMLGAVVKATACIDIESLVKAVKHKIPGKDGELNAKACRRAYEEARVYERA
jgi:pyruvate ferredoxin oxidoreductase gamma subunit/2-oxoisovalerate ferredoxin oxidoreductase gamma subunit